MYQDFQYFWEMYCRAFERRQNCEHRKGGKRRGWGSRTDYNVGFHTFIDGSQKIWCLNGCGFEVWNKPEWSFKWAFGWKMAEQSTNWPSSSEAVIAKLPEPKESLSKAGKEFRPYNFDDPGINIGDASPIKGMQKATEHCPELEDSNDIVVV